MKFTIRKKMIMLLLLVGLLPMLLVAYFSFNKVTEELRMTNRDRLVSLREEKKQQIHNYFDLIRNQIQTFSQDRMIVDAMMRFGISFFNVNKQLGPKAITYDESMSEALLKRYQYQKENTPDAPNNAIDQWLPQEENTRLLQWLYIAGNPNRIGEKHKLDTPSDASTYSNDHAEYHPVIRKFLETFGYYDIFLVEPDTGYIVYSVFKEVDFATSLLTGPYAETGIGKAFQAAVNADKQDFFVFADFEPYAPSYNAPAAFIASPIIDMGEKLGVLIFQAPIDKINAVMTSNKSWQDVGLGKTGEVYLVGPDYKLRNDSRFFIEQPEEYFSALKQLGVSSSILEKSKILKTSIGLNEIRTKGTESAINNEEGFEVFEDYRGIRVLSAYSPIEIFGKKWGILAEIDEEEAFRSRDNIIDGLKVFVIVQIILLIVIAVLIGNKFTRPILALASGMKRFVEKDIKVEASDDLKNFDGPHEEIELMSRGDELGMVSRSFNEMKKELTIITGELVEKQKILEMNTELLLEGAVEGIYGLDLEGNTIFVNPAGAKMVGYNPAEMLGKPQHSLIHHTKADGEPYPKEECHVHAALMYGKVHHEENEVFWKKDGTSFPVEYTSRPIREGNNITGAVVTFSDITARKQAERKLIASEEKIHSVITNAIDGFITINEKGEIQTFNPAAEQMFGFQASEIMGKNVNMLMPESYKNKHDRGLEKYIKTGEAKILNTTVEVQGLRKDGSVFPLDLSLNQFSGDEKKALLFSGILRDVTDRKKAEEALKQRNDTMERELVVAREIQMNMLPTNFPPYPDHKEISLHAKLEPAREVGGDYYDFFFMGENQFGVCVGDVSGKGAPSALFMAGAKALIKNISENEVSPANIL